jgi:hypothetical protein
MKLKKDFIRLTIDLEPELHKKLKYTCVIVDMSMRDLVTEAIEKKVQSLGKKISNELNQ